MTIGVSLDPVLSPTDTSFQKSFTIVLISIIVSLGVSQPFMVLTTLAPCALSPL
jgi:hypothetical protein